MKKPAFKYINDKGILCIKSNRTGQIWRMTMPHDVVEVCNMLNLYWEALTADDEDENVPSGDFQMTPDKYIGL